MEWVNRHSTTYFGATTDRAACVSRTPRFYLKQMILTYRYMSTSGRFLSVLGSVIERQLCHFPPQKLTDRLPTQLSHSMS